MRVVTFDCNQKKESKTALMRTLIKTTLIKPTATAIKLFQGRDKLPTICVFGHDDLKLITPIQEDYEVSSDTKKCTSLRHEKCTTRGSKIVLPG